MVRWRSYTITRVTAQGIAIWTNTIPSMDGEGRLEIVSRDRFIQFSGVGKLPGHTHELLAPEVIGDMAWAKVKFDLPDRQFVDVLALLRLSDGWKIVSKTYTVTMTTCAEGLT